MASIAAISGFTEEEIAVDEGLGYPKAYVKLCRDRDLSPYSHGPPFTFTPYTLQQREATRERDLDEMFPIVDAKAKPITNPKIFVSLLWKQLNHLGNAGFDPSTFRVDPYGNVLYYHADSTSPLAWEIDHWFPCSRGGLTVPSNLRILQWQVCKKKHNKLEFLVPWWDLQLGISINQFLSIFASSNSDFRHRAFSLLFAEGENEELHASQTVDSHVFPQHFIKSKDQVGLAPAAIVLSRKDIYDDLQQKRPITPFIAARKVKAGSTKENEDPNLVANPYQAIVKARDSLKQREETLKLQTEIQKIDNELGEMKQKNEEEKVVLQDLELVLIKRRRRAEKCRRLAEAQSSYRAMLEKMIRDVMHQSVIYKEQLRLNQAATSTLVARLEAQKAICDSSEKELHKKFKQRDEVEKHVRPDWGKARKRSRKNDTLAEESDDKRSVLYLPEIKPKMPLRKELKVFLEEEHKASEAALSLVKEQKEEELGEEGKEEESGCKKSSVPFEENIIDQKLQQLDLREENKEFTVQFRLDKETEREEEDEECRKQRGKGNVEKWLEILLETGQEEDLNSQNANQGQTSETDEIIRKLNLNYPNKEIKILHFPEFPSKGVGKQIDEQPIEEVVRRAGVSTSFEGKERRTEKGEKEKRRLARSESARGFRTIPSSPSMILGGMRKGVDCIGKRPMVTGDDDDGHDHDRVVGNSFLKSSIKTFKKAVKI